MAVSSAEFHHQPSTLSVSSLDSAAAGSAAALLLSASAGGGGGGAASASGASTSSSLSPRLRGGKVNYVSPRQKLDELMMVWLSLPDVAQRLHNLLRDVESGIPVAQSSFAAPRHSAGSAPGLSPPVHPHAALLGGAVAPKSPTVSPASSPTLEKMLDRASERMPLQKSPRHAGTRLGVQSAASASAAAASAAAAQYASNSSALSATLATSATPHGGAHGQQQQQQASKVLPIPQFYFPKGKRKGVVDNSVMQRIRELYQPHPGGMPIEQFRVLAREIVGFPVCMSGVLFRRLDAKNAGAVTRDQFETWWQRGPATSTDVAQRMFDFLRQPANDFLVGNDFREVIREMIETHPGLEFLKSTPEFQEKYADTIVVRIFYRVNRSGTGRITERELRNSDWVEVTQGLDQEPDINKILRYYSYEHFYVLYCKFWELDMDHDQLIDKDDLVRHSNHALTYRIIDRIFSETPRAFTSGVAGKMAYEDFIWFLLSEEDKSTETSLEYWFRAIDLDDDGVISHYEMEFFYTEQLHRMECVQMEPVSFEDILCQLIDMVKPTDPQRIVLADVKRSRLGGQFFNVLFNMHKFTMMEQKDPFLKNDEFETDWDRYARFEYDRLSAEEEGNAQGEGGGEDDDAAAWGIQGANEAPF